jgi:urea transport system ATP-binding protein
LAQAEPLLAVRDIHTYYGDSYVLQGVSLALQEGQIVAILGRNGMGKTTLMKSLMGIVPSRGGTITVAGKGIEAEESFNRVRSGLSYVPQGRMIFSTMTVEENIETGLTVTGEARVPGDLYELFPVLLERKRRRGGNLRRGGRRPGSVPSDHVVAAEHRPWDVGCVGAQGGAHDASRAMVALHGA